MRGKKTRSRKSYTYRRLGIAPYTRREGMSQQDPNSNGDIVKDFQNTGRTGRRNAMADVLGAHKDLSTADLPLKLEKLSTSDLPTAAAVAEEEKTNNCISNNKSENENNSSAGSSSATSASS